MQDGVPSLTAYIIPSMLQDLAVETSPNRHLVPAAARGYNDLFVEWCRKHDDKLRNGARTTSVEQRARGYDTSVGIGVREHVALRKIAIEKEARKAIEDGASQVLILAGGYDTLALRLSKEFPDVQFIETDHPATQVEKLKALKSGDEAIPSNLEFIAGDLAKNSIGEVLGDHFNTKAKTFAVAEGLMMYLKPDDNLKLLKDLKTLLPHGSQIMLGNMDSFEIVKKQEELAKKRAEMAKERGAPMRQDEPYESCLAFSDAPGYFTKLGLEPQVSYSYLGLQSAIRSEDNQAELAQIQETREHYYLVKVPEGKPQATSFVEEKVSNEVEKLKSEVSILSTVVKTPGEFQL